VKWYREPRLITAGIVILAIGAAQTIQMILFVLFSTLLTKTTGIPDNVMSLLAMLPTILSVVAGGAFLGRLRYKDEYILWGVSALVAGIFPIALQLIMYPESTEWLQNPSIWISSAGGLLLWVAGCWLGALSWRLKPNAQFDNTLLRWTAGIVGVVILLYGITWGSIVFSKGYRLAKQVKLMIPSGVEEVDASYREPGVAQMRRFSKIIDPGDKSIQEFYLETMKREGWTDVTGTFQDWEAGQWVPRKETWNDREMEYMLAGAHWQDFSGKVLVTMVLQAIKLSPQADWQNSDWQVQGIILSRPYVEPAQQEQSAVPTAIQSESQGTLEGGINAGEQSMKKTNDENYPESSM